LFIVVNFDVLVLFYFNFQSTKISATVCKLNNATTVKAWGTDCEIQECSLQDSSGEIQLTLWEKQVSQLQLGNSYTFTNLKTRQGRGNLFSISLNRI